MRKKEGKEGVPAPSPGIQWQLVHGIMVHTDFFQKGLVVISTDLNETSSEVNFGSHTLTFSNIDKKPRAREYNKGKNLLSQLSDYSLKRAEPILVPESDACLFNAKRSAEIFFPISLSSDNGMYVLPWSGKKLAARYDGFDNFVTAGCMFGGALQAVFTDKSRLPLIDHNLAIPPSSIVEDIEYDPKVINPFEMVVFNEFKKNCELVKSLTKQGQHPELLYHLPAEDYMLFGFKLYTQRKISKPALDKLLQYVETKKIEHTKKIQEICSGYGIKFEITSPFENIFYGLGSPLTTDKLCSHFGIKDESTQIIEKKITQKCIHLLQTGESNTCHKELWKKFNRSTASVHDIESLFNIGNALMIALGSNNKQDNQTCSILPLSEKQIQVQYDALRKNREIIVPSVVNLTTLDPVIAYSPTGKGLLFYLTLALDKLGKLLDEHRILQKASRNLRFFSQVDKPKTKTNPTEPKNIHR